MVDNIKPDPMPAHPSAYWQDPLRLIETAAPGPVKRLVLWSVSLLVLVMLIWTVFGKLDIIATADGKLVPQTLVKIVQPAEPGVVRQLRVNEGDSVKAGQLLARLDTTLANADQDSVSKDIIHQRIQLRRIDAELSNQPMPPEAGEDPQLYAQVQRQYQAHRLAFLDSLDQEKSLLAKAQHEYRSAVQILAKLTQTLPIYQRSADAYTALQKDGYVSTMAAEEKQREAIERSRDYDAQQASMAALGATIAAQKKRISQRQHTYHAELQAERAEIHAKLGQLLPTLDKSVYKQGLMDLRAPQDGVIKDLSTTTVGAVVQPGTVIMTLVPQDEQLYADVAIKNADVGFVQTGQSAQLKLAAYPFQKYGMLTGKVIRLSADASEPDTGSGTDQRNTTYKARIALDQQTLRHPQGGVLTMSAGMQVVAEIHQGKRTVLEYLLSPLQKAVQESGRER